MATLLAIPNFSEGRDAGTIAAIATALAEAHPAVRLLDTHSDPDHNRTVYTLAGPQGALQTALVKGAEVAVEQIDMRAHTGAHPCVGALDVAPIVYIDPSDRGAAAAEALATADRLGDELEIPVFLYGELTQSTRTRAHVRRGGTGELNRRVAVRELAPDFGPRRGLHPRAGAALVAVRRPLIAFNVELAPPATLETAKQIAALIRESGAEGLPSVRAIGLTLPHLQGRPQVSTNVEDHTRTSLAQIVAAIARHATPLEAELVGLAPKKAFDGFPDDLPVRNRRYLEDALAFES